jgi:hypothetical protein
MSEPFDKKPFDKEIVVDLFQQIVEYLEQNNLSSHRCAHDSNLITLFQAVVR